MSRKTCGWLPPCGRRSSHFLILHSKTALWDLPVSMGPLHLGNDSFTRDKPFTFASQGTPRVGKLSLNCLFAGRNNNNFDLCRPPGN